MTEHLCKCCKMPPVDGCDGWGCIPTEDDSIAMECPNMRIVRVRKSLRLDIAQAEHAKDSPLVGRHRDSLFIHAGSWLNVLPHLKSALGYVLLRQLFPHAIITDERIKSVFVGNERYASRKRETRDDLDANNGLADLMGPPALVIVRLGFLGHKNVAAPGALKEALMVRQAENKPTWIIETEQPFEQSYCFSPDVSLYIDDRFEEIFLGEPSEPDEDPGMEVTTGSVDVFSDGHAHGTSTMVGESFYTVRDESPPDRPPESEPSPREEPDIDVSALEAAISGNGGGKKKFKKRFR